jgi:hypothetical protein
MKPIKQTRFGRILCALGMHLLTSATNRTPDGMPLSTWGGCVRCNSSFQWDF